MAGETSVDLAALNDRYDRLWTKAERLVEAFLDQQLAALETAANWPSEPTPDAKGNRPRGHRAKSGSAAPPRRAADSPAQNTAGTSPLAPAAMREIYIAVQCLKRIHEGRHAVLTGGTDDLQSVRPNDHAKAVAEDISRRIRALCEPNHSNGDDDNPL
jgi:hypothetical protein